LRPDLPNAYKILRRNVYGWFVGVERGVYGLTTAGHQALLRWPQQPSISRVVDRGGATGTTMASPVEAMTRSPYG
jgi:hypothetical protein